MQYIGSWTAKRSVKKMAKAQMPASGCKMLHLVVFQSVGSWIRGELEAILPYTTRCLDYQISSVTNPQWGTLSRFTNLRVIFLYIKGTHNPSLSHGVLFLRPKGNIRCWLQHI